MSYVPDPEFISHARPILKALHSAPPARLHDIDARRAMVEGFKSIFETTLPVQPDWVPTKYTTNNVDGAQIVLYWFANDIIKHNSQPSPVILHFHGGGYVAGNVSVFERFLANHAATTNVPILSVDYRLAPESNGDGPVQDCFAGLTWLRNNANTLNIDPARIAVMGESAGGGLAAGLALYARDQQFSPPIAKQILIYPMLDDRNTTRDERLEEFAVWRNADSITGWTALLGKDIIGTDNVSPYAAPAGAKDLTGLPPAYIDVGELDIFRDEDLEYARKLAAAGVWVEFHLHAGVPHGFEILAPTSDVAKRALSDRARVCQAF
ncbi:arylesterase/monooxygenase [Exophiala viscosa]|uniref:arylesterase/monooxygenase n=1 Tax=Exophiala viscosa TaxID=2486360 RepID=UPI0021A1B2A3|nr:arylesterase/monooxygenase [Exophiala viscosa]